MPREAGGKNDIGVPRVIINKKVPIGRHRIHTVAVMNEPPAPVIQVLLHEVFSAFESSLVETAVKLIRT